MHIAIHHRKGSFSDRWISYCIEKKISYKLVDCYSNDIIQQLSDCSALMWHFHHNSPQDFLFARQLLYAVASTGKKVFPDFFTVWHFDDKVAQKYLLEAAGCPLIPSYVFYKKEKAIEWVKASQFPKVFKLRGGAGSKNVQLVKTRARAIQLVRTAFGKGFNQYDGLSNFKERFRKFKEGQTSFYDVFKGAMRIFYTTQFAKVAGKDRGYVYFQDFVPDNTFDIRIVVIANKAFALKRFTRKNDFRASGSGHISYEIESFDEVTLQHSFETARRLRTQCVAFDFVYKDNHPLLIEISYGFTYKAYDVCPGYWDDTLTFHEGIFDPYGWMVEMIRQV